MKKRNQGWEPVYAGWSEDKVEMSDTYATTHSSTHNEYGVMVQQPPIPYKGNGAIFWIDPQHIYLRFDWGLWFAVDNDDPENCNTICKRRTGTLYLCSQTSIKHHPVKIYHIEKLPEELFGADGPKLPKSRDMLRQIFEDPKHKGDRLYVNEAVYNRHGTTIAIASPGQYPAACFELRGHFLLFTFFNHTDCWWSDEAVDKGDSWPDWYGETGMAISPIAAAKALREQIKPLLPEDVPFHTIVVLNPGCDIMNESDHRSVWETRDRVTLLRQTPIEDSELGTIDAFLDRLQGASRSTLRIHLSAIQRIFDDFPLDDPAPEIN